MAPRYSQVPIRGAEPRWFRGVRCLEDATRAFIANYELPTIFFPFPPSNYMTYLVLGLSPSRSDGAEAASLPDLVLSRTACPIASAEDCALTCIADFCDHQLRLCPIWGSFPSRLFSL